MIAIYLAGMGALFLVAALWLTIRRLRVALRGATAEGKVVGHDIRDLDDTRAYLPIVEYQDASGCEHRFTSVAGSTDRRPDVGTPVKVRYLPQAPSHAYLQSFLHMWAAPVAFAILGVVALAAASRVG